MSPCATIELELVQPSQTVTEEPITPNLDWTDLPKVLHQIIAYHRIFALVGGSAQAGIFLSQAYYWTPKASNPEGWFYKTKEEWEKETGLTRRQQDTVVKNLKELGLLFVELRGIPCKLYYRINKEALTEAIGRHQPIVETGKKSAETTQNQQLHKNAKLDAQNRLTSCTETPNKLHKTAELNPPQNHTQQPFQPPSEITSENTTKNTQISAPPSGAPEPPPGVCVNSIKQEATKVDNQPASSEVEKPVVKTDNQKNSSFEQRLPHEDNNSAPSSLSRNKRNREESANSSKNQQVNQWEPAHHPELKQAFLEWKARTLLASSGDTDALSGYSFARNWARKNQIDANDDFEKFVARHEAEQQRNKEQEEFFAKHREHYMAQLDKQQQEEAARRAAAPPNPRLQAILQRHLNRNT
ncbi:hypothetical protein CAL7716_105380 (plasmid) [Calothrix sp. PCC 7716]|nr:hypothetical protein CAL7716_105380 [Calothrix sp. PCC 7716]